MVWESRGFIDLRLFRVLTSIAIDAGKPGYLRLGALNVLLGWLDPSKYYGYDFSLAPGERRLGHAAMWSFTDQERAVSGPLPVSLADVQKRLLEITAEIQRQGDPAMSRVASDIARGL
jgi:hypothetical protein